MSNFDFKIYVDRYKTYSTYSLTKTADGWNIQHKAHSGATRPDGSPLLVANFDQDDVKYPTGIDGFLQYVWNGLENGAISEQIAAKKIQEIADWVSICEEKQPHWIGWNC